MVYTESSLKQSVVSICHKHKIQGVRYLNTNKTMGIMCIPGITSITGITDMTCTR